MRSRVLIRGLALGAALLYGAVVADVRVNQWIEPAQGIVVRQQIDLYIEVATDGFFSGGTRIADFEVPGGIVLRREQFAVNSTRIEAGTTWAVQRWKIALYPQREGSMQVPSIPVRVITGAAQQQSELVTRAIDFEARLPAGLAETGAWIAAPEFTISERYDPAAADAEMTLDVGDAFTRRIDIRARDSVAMMLPALDFAAPEGVAVYADPPSLENLVNRGVSLAERSETISYVAEHPGRYRLPEIVVDWWDTSSGERRRILLPERLLIVGPGAVAELTDSATGGQSDMAADWLSWLYIATGSIGIGLLIFTWFRFGRRAGRGDDSRSLDDLIDEAVQTNDGRRLLSLLYRWVDNRPGTAHSLRQHIASLQRPEVATAFETVLHAEYGPQPARASPADRKTLRTLARMLEMQPVNVPAQRDPFALN